MEKFLFAMVICMTAMFTSCSDDDQGNGDIRISDDQKNQTAYADDIEKEISFTAATDWSTRIDYNTGTKAVAVDNWVILDPANGEAGQVSMKISLSTNYTGVDRKATIHIVCGKTNITVKIEQKGETEDGNIPDEEETGTKIRQVAEIIQYKDNEPFHVGFNYDELGLISKYSAFHEINGQQQIIYKSEIDNYYRIWKFT